MLPDQNSQILDLPVQNEISFISVCMCVCCIMIISSLCKKNVHLLLEGGIEEVKIMLGSVSKRSW